MVDSLNRKCTQDAKQRIHVIITYPTNGARAIGIITRFSGVDAMRAKNIGGHISQVWWSKRCYIWSLPKETPNCILFLFPIMTFIKNANIQSILVNYSNSHSCNTWDIQYSENVLFLKRLTLQSAYILLLMIFQLSVKLFQKGEFLICASNRNISTRNSVQQQIIKCWPINLVFGVVTGAQRSIFPFKINISYWLK